MDNFMDENITLAIVGIGLGLFGAMVWYAEMFTDSKAANLWRRMNGNGRISRNYAAIGPPHLHAFFFWAAFWDLSTIFSYTGLFRALLPF